MRPKILLIDNYDSFTYNLVQAFLVLGAVVEVHRNDAITTDEALELNPSHLVISPGPGTPRDAGVSMPKIGMRPANARIIGMETPASRGVPGPGRRGLHADDSGVRR